METQAIIDPDAGISAAELISELRQAARRGALTWEHPWETAIKRVGFDLGWSAAQWAQLPWYGPLDPLIARPSVTDIFSNMPGDELRLVEQGRHQPSGITPHPSWSEFIASQLLIRSRKLDPAQPARWPHAIVTGSADRRLRYLLTNAHATPDGISMSIRVLPETWRTLAMLVSDGMLPQEQATILNAALDGGATILIAGMGGSGKTTLAAALLGAIGDRSRVVIIEEARELPRLADSVALEVSDSGLTFAECVRASLRQKPQRVVVGEARGPEALALLWAAATGHPGIGTIHAPSVETALRNLELMAAQGDAPAETIRGLITSPAVQLVIVHIGRYGGKRQVGQIAELAPTAGGKIGEPFAISPIYQVDPVSGQARRFPIQYSLWGRGKW